MDTLLCHLESLVERTRKALQADAAGQQFETVDLETEIGLLLQTWAAALVEGLAEEVDGGRVANRHICACGGHYQFVRKQARWLGFLFGQARPSRARYRCRQCGMTRVPLDEVWGLQAGYYAMGRRYLAPKAQQALAALCAALPYAEAQRHFQVLTGLKVSVMLAWRLVQHLGEQLGEEHDLACGAQEERRASVGERLRWFVGADGVMVAFWKHGRRRTRKSRVAGEQTQAQSQGEKVVWREVKVGVVARLDAAGAVVRGSQKYLVSLAKANSFRIRFSRMARHCGVTASDVVVVVTDGAKWLRALWSRHFQYATAIRDFYHAFEHLGVMGAALYGEGSPWATRWQVQMGKRLKRGEVQEMLAEWEAVARKPKDRATWEREKKYFRSQQEAMAYGDYRKAKLPIGSGVVEGGCKTAVGSRFKRPGARWSEQGFGNLAPLRARYCSGVTLMPQPPSC